VVKGPMLLFTEIRTLLQARATPLPVVNEPEHPVRRLTTMQLMITGLPEKWFSRDASRYSTAYLPAK
jgi:hypothetical protein